MRAFMTIALVGSLLFGATRVVHAQPAQRGCHFRAAIWGLIQETSVDTNLASGYDSTDAVDADRAPLEESLGRKLGRYSYPSGYSLLQTAWSQVWGHIWSVAYWEVQSLDESDPDLQTFEQNKESSEQSAAYASMARLWSAVKAMC